MQTLAALQDVPDTQGELDRLLIQQAFDGDERAFEQLVERYTTPLNYLISRIVRDSAVTQDILQHVFLQLYLALGTLHPSSSLKAWLFAVARNRSVDELRRMRSIAFSALPTVIEGEEVFSLVEIIPDPAPPPEMAAEAQELRDCIFHAIHSLPLPMRRVVWLRYSAHLRFAEIAHLLGVPETTAKTYFQRAKPLLRLALSGMSSPQVPGRRGSAMFGIKTSLVLEARKTRKRQNS